MKLDGQRLYHQGCIRQVLPELSDFKMLQLQKKAVLVWKNLQSIFKEVDCFDTLLQSTKSKTFQREVELSPIRKLFAYFVEKNKQPTERSKGKKWVLSSGFCTISTSENSLFSWFNIWIKPFYTEGLIYFELRFIL